MRTAILTLVLFFVASLPLAIAGNGNYKGPVFDTHLHYSSKAWPVYSPKDVLEKMEQANVKSALVSSTPDSGTETLLSLAPQRLVPGLRPYRNASEKVTWYKNQALLAYSKTRLATLRHKAFGEVILHFPKDLDTPQMSQYFELATKQKLVMHLHTGADVIEALFKKQPGLKVLWAHAGFNEPPEVIARMLDQYPNLWAELSYRAEHIMGADDVEPEWKPLLIRHADRFTVGSDTWENGRWRTYKYLIDQHREWLGKLPQKVASKIAYENASFLFGR
ncbi:hypothetical protein MNBD_ALPHA08-24 [hydrothermal vent metagenome]|uniref:Amidohydrolase-related domain-containing protein n=1 Tax=hydrothermal vent metagenome TaxID=652676 RepID=A0A3B0RRX4_9ZZZZ